MTRQNLLDAPPTAEAAPAPQTQSYIMTPDQALQVARTLIAEGDLQAALYILQKVLQLQPERPDARASFENASRMLAYQNSIEAKRNSTALDYPTQVHIETIALCNAKCVFCVYPEIARKGERMDDDLFAKIIGDLKAIPADHRFSVVPYKINDPFLDKGIFDKLRLINRELPTAGIILTTNGIALREEHIEQLNEIKNITFFWISLNAPDAETYKQRMGVGSFEKVVKNIHMTQERFNRPNLLRIGRVRTGTVDDARFSEYVGREFGDGVRESGNPQGDFLKNVDTLTPALPFLSCGHWFELSIVCTGKVSFCCMDGHCAHPLGDARTENVLSIYNRPPLRTLREGALQRKVSPVCASCNYA